MKCVLRASRHGFIVPLFIQCIVQCLYQLLTQSINIFIMCFDIDCMNEEIRHLVQEQQDGNTTSLAASVFTEVVYWNRPLDV